MEFIKKLCVRDKYFMRHNDIINYGSLVQEAIHEYHNIFESKRWEPTDSKKNSKYEPLLLKDSTVSTEATVNKTVEKVYFKSRHSGKDNKSGVG